MAKIPYQPWSTEQPMPSSGATGFNVRAPEDAFGTNVAAAISHVGTAVEGAGNEMFQRAVALKQLDNEAEAREISNDTELQLSNLRVGYGVKQGKEAADGLPAYQDAVKGVYEGAKSRASNAMVRRMVDGQTAAAMRGSIFAGATHAQTEGRKWQISTLTNRLDSFKNQVLQDPDNEQLWGDVNAQAAKIVNELGDFQGEPVGSDNRKHAYAAAVSDLWSTRIKGLSNKEPERALRMLEAHKGDILGQDVDTLDKLVTDKFTTQVAAQAAHSVMQGFSPYMKPADILKFDGVDERLTRVFQTAQKMAEADGIQFTIGDKGGRRTPEEQAELVRRGVSWTMNSNHVRGAAFDVVPLDANGNPNYKDRDGYKAIEKYIFAAAEKEGVILGPEHAQLGEKDLGHYSLAAGEQGKPLKKWEPPTEREKIDRAVSWFRSIRPNDDAGAIKVENAVMGQHRKYEAVETDQKRKDKETVSEAIALDPDNMYTESDLLAKSDQVDGLKEAWERLGRSDAAWKTRILGSFTAARITHDDQQEYQRIEGLAQNHAEDFLDEDIEANNKLTFASKKHFLAEKKQLRKGDQNPETNRAIGWMRNYPGLSDIMTEQGIHDRTKQNTDAYDTFTGAVHEALASWTKAHKGLTPTQEQVLKEIGPMVLRNRLTTPGWIFGAQKEPFVSWGPFTDPISASLNWMFGPTASNVMNQVIPSDKRDQVKEEFTKEHGYEPSDKEIWRTHVRNQFDELYGAPKEGPRVVKTVKVGKEGAPK